MYVRDETVLGMILHRELTILQFLFSQWQPTTPAKSQSLSNRAIASESTAQPDLRRGIQDETSEDSTTEGEASPPPHSLGHSESQEALEQLPENNPKRKRKPFDTMGNKEDSGKRTKTSQSTLDSPSPWNLWEWNFYRLFWCLAMLNRKAFRLWGELFSCLYTYLMWFIATRKYSLELASDVLLPSINFTNLLLLENSCWRYAFIYHRVSLIGRYS